MLQKWKNSAIASCTPILHAKILKKFLLSKLNQNLIERNLPNWNFFLVLEHIRVVEDTALSLTGHEILDAYNRHTENPTELQIYHQRKFASETINHNKGQDIGSQFDASTNHEIKISVSAQVRN